MFRYRTASHAIAQLTVGDFVSLHRDSESAGKSLSQLEKNISPVGKMKKGIWEIFRIRLSRMHQVINLDSKP